MHVYYSKVKKELIKTSFTFNSNFFYVHLYWDWEWKSECLDYIMSGMCFHKQHQQSYDNKWCYGDWDSSNQFSPSPWPRSFPFPSIYHNYKNCIWKNKFLFTIVSMINISLWLSFWPSYHFLHDYQYDPAYWFF